MDILDKYNLPASRHSRLTSIGQDPFGVVMERIYSATEGKINGRRTILAGTNNYLGLTFEPATVDAAMRAVETLGTGTTGSRIANGTHRSHTQLEQALGRFLNRRSVLVFSTGYQANLGAIAGLAGPKDVIFVDADLHASIYDGCKLSGATVVRFRHNDPHDLDRRLARMSGEGACKLIIVEGLYSMLGDQAPLAEFAEVKAKHGAFLMVDEAHSLGVLGAHGRGAAEADGVEAEVDFVVGTFSKTLGATGGFLASNHPRFDILRFCARPYMYTASAAPATVASVLAALGVVGTRPELRERLLANGNALREGLIALGFDIASPQGPIVAIRMPDEETAVFAWNRLLTHGVYVNLALPPGTPNNLCILRCSLSAAHAPAQIDGICRRFAAVALELRSRTTVEAAE